MLQLRPLAERDRVPEDDTVEMRRIKQMLAAHGPEAFEPLDEIVDTLTRVIDLEPSGAVRDPAPVEPGVAVADLRMQFGRLKATYEAFRIDLLGGAIWASWTDLANPGAARMDAIVSGIQRYLQGWLPSVAGQATAIVGHVLLGLVIMSLSVFYFLKDGPAMIRTVMKLSPLEDHYEQELLSEFDKVSRAVVLATLLSAVVQGVLAGLAYAAVGFNSVFLLTCLTIILAMVPFVGAAAVWLPACLWLAFIEERFAASIGLFAYCALVVSMADNIIKPYVLHGQSKLHPLLGLLSVLGGVQALGPIGILVGPMVVSFLQALLNILHREIQSFDRPTTT
jgi:predicted PurR-regulated permease PerM